MRTCLLQPWHTSFPHHPAESRHHINARCKTLVTYGLLVHLENGVSDITCQGDQYRTSELEARDLQTE